MASAIVDWTKAIGCTPESAADRLYATRPSWVRGQISHHDARYLMRRVLETRPTRVIEIGVSSGVSTATVCHGLELARKAGLMDDHFEIRSYDILDRFAHDRGRRIGDAARAMLPEALLNRHVVFRTGATAQTAAQEVAPETVDLLFIDADHCHPWPALDLLALLHVLRPGAEVVLHDINLPTRMPDTRASGAMVVFEALDVPKQRDEGDPIPNIGSMWVPNDTEGLRRQLMDLVDGHEWETSVPDWVTEPLLG